jgi:hypothetical protein
LIDGYVIYINIFLKAPEQDDFATIGRVMWFLSILMYIL